MRSIKQYPFLFIVLSCIFFTNRVHGQYTFNDVENVSAVIQPVVNLTLVKNNTAAVNFNSSNAYINGVTVANFNTFKIKSNVSWLLNVSSSTTYFTASGSSSSSNMPASVLGFTVGSTSAVYRLSTTATRLASGSRGNEAESGNTFNLNLVATPKYDYGPGIYTIAINYTLTAQ